MGALADRAVAVLFGGSSGEREVSIDTGHAVRAALEEAREAGIGPRAVVPVEWCADGSWSVDGGPPRTRDGVLGAPQREFDLVFLALHGGDGENGVVQRALEDVGLAYTGSGPEASRLAMDKLAARDLATAAGLKTARAVRVTEESWRSRSVAEELRSLYASGMVVKPRRGGSSIDTAHAGSAGELADALEAVFAGGDEALVEECLHGIELTCGVLGNATEELRALPPVEIRPHEGRFFDYEEKYSDEGALELCPPESVEADRVEELQRAAVAIHAGLGCDGYSRSDFFLTESGLVYLETNTLPGFTGRSLMPQEARAAGTSFPELCCWILEAALRRATVDARPTNP